MSAQRITAAARVQRLLAMLQFAAQHPEGVPVEELCARFRLGNADVARELDLASMIGADSTHYDDMPFEVFLEDGLVFVRLFSFRRPMRLSPAEGLALVASADVLVDRGDVEAGGPLARALDKLAALLGIDPGTAVDIDLDPDGGELGRVLRDAIERDRRVTFTYWTYGRDEVARRTVDPWAVFTEDGTWYLTGHAHDAGARRTFRFDRIEEVVVEQDERTHRPPAGHTPVLDPGADAPLAVLELGPGARWIAEAHPVVDAVPVSDDRVRVTLAVSGTSWLERLLLQVGREAEVVSLDPALGPPDLARQAARRVLARYEGGV